MFSLRFSAGLPMNSRSVRTRAVQRDPSSTSSTPAPSGGGAFPGAQYVAVVALGAAIAGPVYGYRKSMADVEKARAAYNAKKAVAPAPKKA